MQLSLKSSCGNQQVGLWTFSQFPSRPPQVCMHQKRGKFSVITVSSSLKPEQGLPTDAQKNQVPSSFPPNTKYLDVCMHAQSDLMEYSLPASSVHRIFQAEILKCSCRALFQGIFLTQGSNPHLLHLQLWEADSLPLSHLGSPELKYSPHTLLQTTKCGYLVLKHGILFFPHDTRLSATPLTIY